MKNIVLIFCCESDTHAEYVADQINKIGYKPILLHREEYSNYWTMSCSFKEKVIEAAITYKNEIIDINQIHSIYLRRDFTIESQDIEGNFTESEKKYIAAQRSIHVNSCLKFLAEKIPIINHPEANYRCLSKILQLFVANKVGLKIPGSFIGGDVGLININLDNNICIKPLEGLHLKENDNTYAHYTQLLDDVDLESLETLSYCPMILQDYIKKEYELRVTIVGKNVFACKIESQKSSLGNIDWRHHDWEHTPHYPTDIPKEISAKLIKMMSFLGITYGAIDMIFTGDDYFFLEVNSMGQWLWIEDLTGLPISKSIAELLTYNHNEILNYK